MTGDNRNENARGFADRVNAAASDIGTLRDVMAQLLSVDARLRQQLERMERTEKQITTALGLLQGFSQSASRAASQGQAATDVTAANGGAPGQGGNGRNQQQWQASLARLVFGGGDDGNIQ